jgi:predicted DNA-binding transcriptional regulator AlpA
LQEDAKGCANVSSENNAPDIVVDEDLWHIDVVCRFFGGSKPLNAATVYRNIKSGRIPPPIKTGPGSARWIPAECRAARDAMIAERNESTTTT